VFQLRRFQTLVVLVLVANLSIGSAASPAIGVVMARGTFQVDESRVSGNGTLFDGTTVETGKASSELHIQGGVRMFLGSDSRGKVYRDYLVLERGQSELASGPYRINARTLQILAADSYSGAKVTLEGANRIQVAALRGPVRITNGRGVLIANLEAGRSIDLDQQDSGAVAPSKLTGCLRRADGRFLLTDDTAGITVELLGSGLEKEVGFKIEVIGSQDPSATPATGASQVVRAHSFKEISKRCASGGAAASGSGGVAGTGSGTGTAAGTIGGIITTKAVIAGVVVAAAATGTAVGLTRRDDTKPPISK
jgi:hypothetical protein